MELGLVGALAPVLSADLQGQSVVVTHVDLLTITGKQSVGWSGVGCRESGQGHGRGQVHGCGLGHIRGQGHGSGPGRGHACGCGQGHGCGRG